MSARASDISIDIWYGRRQRFGHIGNPQRFANILGRVCPVGHLSQLSYSLNGGPPARLSVGPDGKRLQSPGDFNIELDRDELAPGDNQVVVTATDRAGRECREDITVSHMPGRVWPLPYHIDWRACSSISDAAQVVDGLWVLDSAGVRPAEIGYDRAVAIGDISWQHYEVRVECTIHRFGRLEEWGPGVGVLLHWKGHYDWGDGQPLSGWWPTGAIGWYLHLARWNQFRLNFFGNRCEVLAEDPGGKRLATDICYILRLRADPGPCSPTVYRMKVWPKGEQEPGVWDISGVGSEDELAAGSLLLLSHHVDVTFGDLRVEPVG